MYAILMRFGSLAVLVVAGFALAAVVTHGQTMDESDAAIAQLEAAPDRLDISPGEVLYIRTEYFQRFGPKAEEVQKVGIVRTESSVRESYFEIGKNREIARSVVATMDASGTLVQIDAFDDGVLRSINARTGEVILEHEKRNTSALVDRLSDAARSYATSISDGRVEVVTLSPTQVLVSSELKPLGTADDWQRDGFFQLPFYLDLQPEALRVETTISTVDGTERLSETYAVSGEGKPILIAKAAITELAVVDRIPEYPLSISASLDEGKKEAEIESLLMSCGPRDCTDDKFNTLGGVSLEALNSVFANPVDPPDGTGYSAYSGGAESHASTTITAVRVTGSGGHQCNYTDFHNQWYSYNPGNGKDASSGATVSFGTCFFSWAAWTDGAHTLTKSGSFGWSPYTHAEWVR